MCVRVYGLGGGLAAGIEEFVLACGLQGIRGMGGWAGVWEEKRSYLYLIVYI